ncbi:MAG TPA: phospholipid carrier-dependent glycosyltransferase [Vicinamibacterales bacterium]|nr:phospholipid carrier-dependent glycosyltransferase [Vicinamibacterales bacterium]
MNGAQRGRLGLVLALIVAALLRFWALSQGIGFNPGVDEPEIMERAVRMMKTGDLHPHFFDYPSLYMYVQAAVATVRFLAGAMQGKWTALAQAPTEDFYLWGRAVTALLGTATVWVVYRVTLRWSAPAALLAAVLVAVMPLHVRESHYTLTDVPATFAVMATLLLSLRAHERGTIRAFAAAGAMAGLAGALKYNGGLAVVMPLLACAMTPAMGRRRGTAALAIVAATIAAFLAGAPYTLLDLPTFLNQFARLSSEYRQPSAVPEPIWIVYLKHLRIALQWPGSVLVIAGFALGLWKAVRGPNRVPWVLAIVFPLVYFRFMSKQNIAYARYLLPLVPFLSILAAAAVTGAVSWMRRAALPVRVRHVVTVALTILSIAPPAYTAIKYDADAAKPWTQALAYEWIRRELPPGTSIRIEGSTSPKLPATYQASYVKQLRLAAPTDYRGSGIQYLVASSMCYGLYFGDPQNYRTEYEEYQHIFAQAEEVARFTASREHPGPELRILKVRTP